MNSSSRQSAEDVILYILAILGVAVIISMAVSFPIGAYAFNSQQLPGSSVNKLSNDLPLLLFGINLPLPLPFSFSYESLFLLSWAINLTLFVILLMGPWASIRSALKRIKSEKNLAIYSNAGLSVAILFPAVLVIAALIEQFLNSIGLPVGNFTNSDQRYLFLLSTIAPLREEIGFRVSFVGLAAMIIALLAKGWSAGLKALWHPSKALNEAKIQVWRQPGLIIAILLSSFAFGAAHVIYGGGWEIGKFVSASIVGLVLAAVYYTHGFAAAVILHWGFDYYQSAFLYFDQMRGVLDSSGNFIGSSILLSTTFYSDIIIVLTASALYLLLFIMIIKGFMMRRKGQITLK